jgi:hypothetical protein
MDLLSEVDIKIYYDTRSGQWKATVDVNNSSTSAMARWPELAIGRAVIQQADMTEDKLKEPLQQ